MYVHIDPENMCRAAWYAFHFCSDLLWPGFYIDFLNMALIFMLYLFGAYTNISVEFELFTGRPSDPGAQDVKRLYFDLWRIFTWHVTLFLKC